MRQCIGDRSLEERFWFGMKRLVGCEVVVEGLKSREEAAFFVGPRQGGGVVPPFASLHRAEGPAEQIAHVSEDLNGPAAATVEGGECVRGTIESAGGRIGNGCDGVAQQLAFVIHTGKYTAGERDRRQS